MTSNRMPDSKFSLWLGISLASLLIWIAFAFWVFSLSGMENNLYRSNQILPIVIGVAVLALLIPLLMIVARWRSFRRKRNRSGSPSLALRILTAIWAVLPIVLCILILVLPQLRMGDKPPVLLLAGSSDSQGVPALALAYWTQALSQDTVTYGFAGEKRVLTESQPSREHRFSLTGLEAGQFGWYQVNSGSPVEFRTPTAAEETLRFAVAGDPHFGAAKSRPDQTSRLLQTVARSEDLFFCLGDFVQFGIMDGEWTSGLQSIAANAGGLPTAFLVGNHDSLFGGKTLWEEYLGLEASEPFNNSPFWRRMDINGIHFLLLDLEWGTESYLPTQQQWLEQQLSEIPKEDWTIVLCHCYTFSSGWDLLGIRLFGMQWYDQADMIETMAPLFARNGVDLVISGHNHDMELLSNQGVHYAVVGTMGGIPNPVPGYRSPDSLWFQTGIYGYLGVDIKGDEARLVFSDSEGEPMKGFVFHKSQDGPSEIQELQDEGDENR
jgi:UDP-2,3-diacylglucosamine pyrophosphatase LpxH/heme/copper-type cytochrome/quinol oxidase subunit 2